MKKSDSVCAIFSLLGCLGGGGLVFSLEYVSLCWKRTTLEEHFLTFDRHISGRAHFTVLKCF